jgi:hypothetical protein
LRQRQFTPWQQRQLTPRARAQVGYHDGEQLFSGAAGNMVRRALIPSTAAAY